ncbi:MFS transporter [Thorsellia kenyensis]|uniref:MFS transporter n=1 Tax=Thorsellia kenyensis TaxID=1549888 RepID=A0ABV6CCH5_9GAMM
MSKDAQKQGQEQLENSLDTIGVTKSHKVILILILAGVMFDVFEQNTIGLIGPLLKEYWGITPEKIGLLNTVTFIFAAIGRITSGYFSDLYGRRVMLRFNIGFFAIGSVLCAISPNYGFLLFSRAVVGFGLGGEISTAVTILSEFCSTRFRGTAVGLVNVGGGGLANMLAPAIALGVFTLIPTEGNWRYLYVTLFVPTLIIFYFRKYIPESPRYLLSKGKVEETNKVLSILSSGKLSYQGNTTPYITAQVPKIEMESRLMIWKGIFQGKLLIRTIIIGIAVSMAYGSQISVLSLMPTILVEKGLTIEKSFTFTIIMQTGSLLGAITAAWLGYYVPRKRVLMLGATLATAMALCFAFVANSMFQVILFGAFFQFSVLLLNTTLWMYAPELYPTKFRGFGTAFILALGSCAGSLAPIFAGKILKFDGAYGGIPGMFTMIAIFYVILFTSVLFAQETFGKPVE